MDRDEDTAKEAVNERTDEAVTERTERDEATEKWVDDAKTVSRAEGRPPEERSSQDPTAQAETILEDSEDRTRSRDAAAGGDHAGGPAPKS